MRSKRDHARFRLLMFGCLSVSAGILSAQSGAGNVGLSLFFENGQMAPLIFYGNPSRYLQEIDVTYKSPPSPVDTGIDPLKQAGDFANLDWTGVHMVEEEWRASGAKFTRVRYYRGAVWMYRRSTFTLTALDHNGAALGIPIIADAGWDDRLNEETDDAWVRRFTARQTATGCPAINDCTGATYIAQAIVSLRDALHPGTRARTLAATAAALELRWSESRVVYRVPLRHASSPAAYSYGLQPTLELVNAPANGVYFLPGDAVRLRIVLKDGGGRRLHPPGSLPTYQEVMSGSDPSGIRYYNPNLNPQPYYAFKHREANGLVTLAGPTDKMTTSKLTSTDSFAPQVLTATVATDGFTGLVIGYPPSSVTRNGGPPNTPVSDIVTFTLPPDSLPGTYVAALKARREFGGEALNKGALLSIQVGTSRTSGPATKVGECQDCHEGRSSFANILHGLPNITPCAGCHTAATFVGAFDQRVHTIHDRSNRFDENINECRTCHLQTPGGPAAGIVIHKAGARNPAN